jgi:hypothetical protein
VLCEKLGFASPRYLLAALWPDERAHWVAYYEILNEDRERARDGSTTADDEPLLPAFAMLGYFEKLAESGHAVQLGA